GGRILSEHYFAELERHLDLICRPHGLFLDEQVTGQIWKGQRRRVRIALYRRQPKRRKGREATPDSILRALHNATSRFKSGLDSLGIEARRCTGADLYEWLLPWLTPYPGAYGGDAMRLLSALPYPEDAFRLPYGRDLAEWLTHSMPVSDYETRTWWFDAKPHAIVSTQALEQRPEIGHFTRERENGARLFALQDKLPEGSVLAITWVCKVQDEVKAHIFRLRETSKGGSIEAEATRDDCDTALRLLEGGHKCFPCQLSVFIRADQIQQLEDRRRDVETLLHQSGIKPIAAESDLLGLESYVRHLPFNYCPELDKKARRSRLTFSYDLAGMVPFYGRSRGTGNPGFLFFNRGGEDMTFDPLSRMDRTKNGHLLLLGPSGAGKSAMLVYLILQAIAVHNPRVFLIEAGNSFGLLTQYLANYGLTTHQVRLDARNRDGISLCPFLDAIRAL
ncbi:MAG: TraC family protein, partial [Gammaproteobacteria bacterium]|nr:TraC family protein [Gammaproteobacteria bacterium]